eukprot:Rmarinus@m.9795
MRHAAFKNIQLLGSRALLRVQQNVLMEDFVVSGISTVNAPVIYNLGFATFRNGSFSHNSVPDTTAVVVNRFSLTMFDVSFVDNGGCVLESTADATLWYCEFQGNGGDLQPGQGVVRNYGILEISNSTFLDSPGSQASEVEGWVPFILRDTFISSGEALAFAAKCNTTLPDGFATAGPCGQFASCSPSEVGSGVHCGCPSSDPLGDPTVQCGSLAKLLVLPSSSVVVYAVKEWDDEESELVTVTQTVRLLVDGLGFLNWWVPADSTPGWVSLSPASGSMQSFGVCPDGSIDAELQFDLWNITAQSPHVSTEIPIYTEALYMNEYSGDIGQSSIVPLLVTLSVEVEPYNETSLVSVSLPSCRKESGECVVEAGARVDLWVELRDCVGLSMGVGGYSFQVRTSAPVEASLVDFDNGSYALGFDAPQTHFEVDVRVGGGHVRGSPLFFSVKCASGDEWSNSDGHCVDSSLEIPRKIVAISLAVAFFCFGHYSVAPWVGEKYFCLEVSELHFVSETALLLLGHP